MTSLLIYALMSSMSTLKVRCITAYSSSVKLLQETSQHSSSITERFIVYVADSVYTSAEAQHVILTEPLLDPAVEAQAVGRVHRIGQTQPTFVHR